MKEVKYKDSSTINKELYAWKITSIFNSSEFDKTTNKKSISKYEPFYCHFTLNGGTPNERINLKYKIYFPNGETNTGGFDEDLGNGSSGELYYKTGIYEFASLGKTGTWSVKYYDESGNEIGKASVKITD